jgi:predicted kinase
MALQLGKNGIPSIFDLGFQRREHRQEFSSLIKASGFSAKMHVLDIDASVRWERVQSRNSNPGKTFSMEITRDMFDYIEGIWERPSQAEMKMLSDM